MARKWHAYGMADWKIGAEVMCFKDYGDCKQGMKGIIIAWEGSWHPEATISYRDGAGKVKIKKDYIGDHFTQI